MMLFLAGCAVGFLVALGLIGSVSMAYWMGVGGARDYPADDVNPLKPGL